MKRLAATLAVTALLTAACLQWHLFGAIGGLLAVVSGSGNEAAKIDRTFLDERSQEISHGENPRDSLLRLVGWKWWGQSGGRTVLIGNSQTFSIILAPNEQAPNRTPKTYPDLIRDELQANGGGEIYRLSAPNLSYPEALWYVTYLATVDRLKPKRLILQLNYESFRKAGIRDGMLSMLDEPEFAKAVEQLIVENGRYSGALEQAAKRYREKREAIESEGKAEAADGSLPPGARIEARLRGWAQKQELWKRKHEAKADVLNLLYLLRVYVLRITPTTPRPLSGATYETSVAALERIAIVCRESGMELRLFLAPQNPAARMWLTAEDRERYLGACRRVAQKNGVKLADLENAIPADCWGVWIDGPDPIHFGLKGHRMMAEAVMRAGLLN